MELGDVTLDTFVPLVGATFDVRSHDGLTFELSEAVPRASPPGDRGRSPFTLTFRGPPDPVLGQSIYPLAHPVLGTLELFIVPVGRDAAGTAYEAVFT